MASRIPLRCDICPKKPRFSDVSHLLTHIGSKAHLHKHFDAKCRSNTDTESRRLVEDYDQWYAEWNIQDLLADRIDMKDKKKAKPKVRGANRGGTRPPATASSSQAQNGSNPTPMTFPPVPPSQMLTSQRYHDPNLPSQFQHFGIAPSAMNHNFNNTTQNGGNGGFIHYSWPNQQNNYPDPHQFRLSQYANNTNITGTSTGDNTLSQSRNWNLRARRPLKLEDSTYQPTEDTEGSEEDGTESRLPDAEAEPVHDATSGFLELWPVVALKGFFFPGMSCFDAADPIQRSQRNQKKPENRYRQLQLDSEYIAVHGRENCERILIDGHSTDWAHYKERAITGIPNPSSIAGSSPPPSTRGESSKARRRPKAAPRTRYENEEATARARDGFVENGLNRSAFFGNSTRHLSVYRDDDEDAESASTNTFAHRPQPHSRRLQSLNPNQENEHREADHIIKTDDDGTGSTTLGHFRDPTHFLGQPLIPPPSFGQPGAGSSPQSGPTLLTGFGSDFAIPRGQLARTGFINTRTGAYRPADDTMASYNARQFNPAQGLHNLATAATRQPQQPFLPGNRFANHNYSYPNSFGSQAPMDLSSLGTGWAGFQQPVNQPFQPINQPFQPFMSSHHRHSSQNYGMAQLPDPAILRSQEATDQQLALPTYPQPQTAFNFQRSNAQPYGQPDMSYNFGQNATPIAWDGAANTVQPLESTSMGYHIAPSLPPIRLEPPVDAATTPMIMGPPPVPTSTGRRTRVTSLAGSSPSRARGTRGRPRGLSRCSSGSGSSQPPPGSEVIVVEDDASPTEPPEHSGDTTDEERTLTAPPTPGNG